MLLSRTESNITFHSKLQKGCQNASGGRGWRVWGGRVEECGEKGIFNRSVIPSHDSIRKDTPRGTATAAVYTSVPEPSFSRADCTHVSPPLGPSIYLLVNRTPACVFKVLKRLTSLLQHTGTGSLPRALGSTPRMLLL